MGAVRARMRETLVAVWTFERLLSRMYAHVLLEMMLEFESLAATFVAAFEFSQFRAVGMIGKVSLQLRQVGELLRAHRARLERGRRRI